MVTALKDLLNSEHYALLNELRQLRNQAAHDEFFDITKNSAKNYIDLALLIAEELIKK